MSAEGAGRGMEVVRVTGDPGVAEVAVVRFRGDDRTCVEVVDGLAPPLSRARKWIVNVSTQFGCPVGCPFCDAAGSWAGNPTADELLAQVRWALGRHPGEAAGCSKLKVHFARMGEPSLNDAVLEALERLPGEVHAAGLWCCVASVAPRGREAWFERLRGLKDRLFPGRFQLQFSIQSTDAAARTRLTPIPHWSLEQIASYGRRFHRAGDRKVVLNFALARDVAFDPAVLAATFEPEHFAVKLTPVNPTARGAASGFRTVLRSKRETEAAAARERLGSAGFDVVWSVGDPAEDRVGSNCGQAVRVTRPATSAAGRADARVS
jgi:23S rRNA (adenine2503-C2)-methyltransferase